MTHSSSTPHRFPIDALALVVAASIVLLVLQGVTLPKLWPSITQFRLFGSPAEYVTALVELPWSTTDYVLLTALLATGIALLSLELHSRRWTLLIKAVASTETRSRWAVVLGGLVAVRFYFSPGTVTWTADAAYHTLYTWIAGEVFASGSLPVWTPLVAAGTPFLQFYGFVFFYNPARSMPFSTISISHLKWSSAAHTSPPDSRPISALPRADAQPESGSVGGGRLRPEFLAHAADPRDGTLPGQPGLYLPAPALLGALCRSAAEDVA